MLSIFPHGSFIQLVKKMTPSSTFLHLLAVLHYIFLEFYYFKYVDLPNDGPYEIFHTLGGRYKYLTVLNMTVQALFFGVCLIDDFFQITSIRKLRDFLYSTLIFPLSLMITINFWAMWTIDRELIYPSAMDQFFPPWYNHSMHTTILIYSLLHGYFTYNQYPKRSTGMMFLTGVISAYLSWLLIVRLTTGLWAYPIFHVTHWALGAVFIFTTVSFLLLSYITGEYYNQIIWGRRSDLSKTE